MNEPLDDLEGELASLRPRQATSDLKGRIESKLAAPITLSRWYAPLAVAASIAIAGLLVFVFSTFSGPGPSRTATSRPSAGPDIDSSVPSVIAYQHALSKSEADFAALLDRHAAASHGSPASKASPTPEAPRPWLVPLQRNTLTSEERL